MAPPKLEDLRLKSNNALLHGWRKAVDWEEHCAKNNLPASLNDASENVALYRTEIERRMASPTPTPKAIDAAKTAIIALHTKLAKGIVPKYEDVDAINNAIADIEACVPPGCTVTTTVEQTVTEYGHDGKRVTPDDPHLANHPTDYPVS